VDENLCNAFEWEAAANKLEKILKDHCMKSIDTAREIITKKIIRILLNVNPNRAPKVLVSKISFCRISDFSFGMSGI
jgi:hypothetical protein